MNFKCYLVTKDSTTGHGLDYARPSHLVTCFRFFIVLVFCSLCYIIIIPKTITQTFLSLVHSWSQTKNRKLFPQTFPNKSPNSLAYFETLSFHFFFLVVKKRKTQTLEFHFSKHANDILNFYVSTFFQKVQVSSTSDFLNIKLTFVTSTVITFIKIVQIFIFWYSAKTKLWPQPILNMFIQKQSEFSSFGIVGIWKLGPPT